MTGKLSPQKEKYEPPTVRRVRLVPDEIAVVGCKVSNASAGPTGVCQVPPPFLSCKDPGS